MEEFVCLSVGQIIPQLKTKKNEIRISYNSFGWILCIGFPAITEEEQDCIIYGGLSIGFTLVEDVLFFIFKFGKMEWMDAPYEPALYAEPQNYDEVDTGMGASLIVCCADTATGMVMGLRSLGLTNMMSNKLHTTCNELDKRHRPLDISKYHQTIKSIYQRYPTSAQMLPLVKQEHISLFPAN